MHHSIQNITNNIIGQFHPIVNRSKWHNLTIKNEGATDCVTIERTKKSERIYTN